MPHNAYCEFMKLHGFEPDDFCSRGEKKMSEPSYEEHIRILIAFLNSDIDEELKIEMVKAFVKKFG